MNIRQLRHFLAVIDLGSLAAAAEAVHLSQPALSRSLRALEDVLRVPLFDRQDRRLRPTPYALAYVERARRMVFDDNEGARSLALMRDGELGSLAFGMGSSIAKFLLAPLMLEMLGRAPGLRMSAMVQSTDVLHAALLKEQLDFFIGDVRIAQRDPDMVVEAIYPCTFGWFARAGHPLATKRKVTMAQLSAYPLISAGYADESVERKIADLYGLGIPISKHFSLSTSDLGTVHALLASSDAVTPSTGIAVLDPLKSGVVVPLDVTPSLDLDLTLGIIHRAGRTLAPASTRAFEFIRKSFENAAAELLRLHGRRDGSGAAPSPRKRASQTRR
ncbi:LysR family transcriptional regulator [Variovorax sp. J22R133]|uniref:LysR family transcriptional regulator n=1 Tax=Variovorax brevis TaxID=3053503 RepID=UPI002576B2B6|nr:LysR family transcriptional regulator [Variovorax sp. J22R133]MDM0112354.1 LysR family transcriptional regulator [Variovorax sp. J22R133]